MIRLTGISQRLGYVLCAQWTRDIAWTAFTILLARHSQVIFGQIMLALALGYYVRTAVDAGMNDFLLSSFAKRDSRPLSLLSEILWLKLGLLSVALLAAWVITGVLGYECRLRLIALAIAGASVWTRSRTHFSPCVRPGVGRMWKCASVCQPASSASVSALPAPSPMPG